MFLQYGTYRHAANECSVAISRQGRFAAGIQTGRLERWDVRGRLQAANQTQLSAAIAGLQTAYAQGGLDLGFYFDSGAPTAHALLSNQASGGTRVIKPPDFPQGQGAEYSTFRNYGISVEAEFLDPTLDLIGWQEVLNLRGGGPQFGYLEPINGLPQKQLLKQATTFRAAQQGHAVGMFSYPLPPAPIWPDAEHQDQRAIIYELPKRSGRGQAATYSEFRVSWNYAFESDTPLIGLPTPWPA